MKDEQLEESEAVLSWLERAKYWQRAINNLANYDKDVQQRLTKVFEEYKVGFILHALDIARFEKSIEHKIYEQGELYIEKVANEIAENMIKRIM